MDERRAGRAGVSDKWKTTDVSKVSVSLPECIKPTTIVHREKEKKVLFCLDRYYYYTSPTGNHSST